MAREISRQRQLSGRSIIADLRKAIRATGRALLGVAEAAGIRSTYGENPELLAEYMQMCGLKSDTSGAEGPLTRAGCGTRFPQTGRGLLSWISAPCKAAMLISRARSESVVAASLLRQPEIFSTLYTAPS